MFYLHEWFFNPSEEDCQLRKFVGCDFLGYDEGF